MIGHQVLSGNPHGGKARTHRGRRLNRPCLSTPGKKKTGRNAVAPGHLGYLRARRQRFFHKTHFLVGRPPPPPLKTAKNLNPHRSTLKLALRSHAPGKAATKQGGAGRTDTYRTPHTDQLHVVERLKLAADGQTVDVSAFVEDPGAFTMAWDAVQHHRRVEEGPMLEVDCAENNNGFFSQDVEPMPIAAKPDF